MADLELDIVGNIKKLTSELKEFNRTVDKTDDKLDKASKSAKSMGSNLSTAFKAFLIGGAIQRGVGAIKADIVEMNDSALGVVRSLKEISFLKGLEGQQVVKDIAASTGLSIDKVAGVAGPVFSANPNMTMGTLRMVVENALTEERSSNAPAGVVASGSSGLVNAFPKQFKDPIGAQNFLMGVVKESNMAVSQIGDLAPLFGTAAAFGLAPEDVSAAFNMVTSLNIKPTEAVTMINALMAQWSIYGKPQGMTFLEFINYAVKIKDPKKKQTVLTATGAKAAGIVSNKGQSAFNALSSGFAEIGKQKSSSSVIDLNEKISSGELVGEQLDMRLSNLKKNRVLSPEDLERNAIIGGRVDQAWEEAKAFMKDVAQVMPMFMIANQMTTGSVAGDMLGAQNNRNLSNEIGSAIEGRRDQVTLGNVLSKIDKNLTGVSVNNVKASTRQRKNSGAKGD